MRGGALAGEEAWVCVARGVVLGVGEDGRVELDERAG